MEGGRHGRAHWLSNRSERGLPRDGHDAGHARLRAERGTARHVGRHPANRSGSDGARPRGLAQHLSLGNHRAASETPQPLRRAPTHRAGTGCVPDDRRGPALPRPAPPAREPERRCGRDAGHARGGWRSGARRRPAVQRQERLVHGAVSGPSGGKAGTASAPRSPCGTLTAASASGVRRFAPIQRRPWSPSLARATWHGMCRDGC